VTRNTYTWKQLIFQISDPKNPLVFQIQENYIFDPYWIRHCEFWNFDYRFI